MTEFCEAETKSAIIPEGIREDHGEGGGRERGKGVGGGRD